ncbi:MAG: plasmid pRiA4b ORF-3 family protein [Lachnospiraceae bacterium]|nr:plasmid pRiA4b ORF-3 family protein [Lachnospiraceae bacterium]
MAGYTVKVTIEYTHPPVWRRIVLPEGITFYSLHRILQTVFGWDGDHLHDFRTSDGICISLPEARTSGSELSEDATTIDDFLKSGRWIRYTYDFGDDWRHKIVFEKEDPAYDKRYAAVLKAKGDNFMEDTPWDEADSNRKPFSITAANATLEKMPFSKKKTSKKQAEEIRLKDDQKKINDTLAAIQKLYKENGKTPKSNYEIIREIFSGTFDASELLSGAEPESIRFQNSSGDTASDEVAKTWGIFASAMQKMEERLPSGGTVKKKTSQKSSAPVKGYVQMTLPGLDEIMPKRTKALENGFPPEGYRVDIVQSEKTVQEMLAREDAKRLREFCKFSVVDPSALQGNVSKRKMAGLILDAFRQHPECLYYIFSIDQYKWIHLNCFSNAVNVPLPESFDAVGKLLNLGFAEIQYWMEGGIKVAEISVAADLASILPNEKGKKLKRSYNLIESNTRFLSDLLLLYGVAEIAEIFQLYPEHFERCSTLQDFLRFVYWHCRYNEFLFTGSIAGRKNIMVHPVFDPNVIVPLYLKHPDIPCKVFSDKSLWDLRDGYCCYSMQWESYFTNLTMRLQNRTANEIDSRITDTLRKVMEGCTLDEILAYCRNHLDIPDNTGMDEEISLWGIAMELAMETPLPLFHGYSRYEAMTQLGIDVNGISLFPVQGKKKRITKNTALTELSPEQQLELYNLYYGDDTTPEDYDQFMKEIGCSNYSVRYLKIEEWILRNDFIKAEEETKRLIKESGHQEFTALLNEIREYRELAADDDEEDGLLSDAELDALIDEMFRYPH